MVRERVHRILKQCGISGKERLVAGVSGGVDSMVLLHVLHSLEQPLVVAHMNYHRRGAESDADEVLVRKSSELMGIPCHVRSVHYQKGDGNFQDWARQMRYRFFDEIRKKTGATGIAVAHQKDDQVETILMKLMRGAGPLSWTGMHYWDGTYLRPLLDVTRTEIDKYAREHEIPSREDASNLESDYARNFIRNEWTPELNELLPGWQQNILRLRNWSLQMNEALEIIEQELKAGDACWDFEKFCMFSGRLQQALVRFWLKKYCQGEILVSHGNLEEITNICHLQSGQHVKLGAVHRLWRDRDRLVLTIASSSIIDEKGELKIGRDELIDSERVFGFARFYISDEYPREYGKKLYCRLNDVDWPLTVRRWKNGDRFQPLGMKGHQLVSDFLTNRKIPSHRKKEALVVVSFDQRICAVIFPPSPAEASAKAGSIRHRSLYGPVSPPLEQVGFSGQSPPHWEPGGIAETVRCPDKPVAVLTIEPIL